MFQPPLGSTTATYKLFISHAWEYAEEYDGIVRLLDGYWGFKWENLSVPIDNPIQIWELLPKSNRRIMCELDDRINRCDCLLVLAAMYVNHRGWIQSEIEAAQEYGKPIIAIKPHGQERVPTILPDLATEIVGWHTPSIVSAILRHAKPTGGHAPLYPGTLSSPENSIGHKLAANLPTPHDPALEGLYQAMLKTEKKSLNLLSPHDTVLGGLYQAMLEAEKKRD